MSASIAFLLAQLCVAFRAEKGQLTIIIRRALLYSENKDLSPHLKASKVNILSKSFKLRSWRQENNGTLDPKAIHYWFLVASVKSTRIWHRLCVQVSTNATLYRVRALCL